MADIGPAYFSVIDVIKSLPSAFASLSQSLAYVAKVMIDYKKSQETQKTE